MFNLLWMNCRLFNWNASISISDEMANLCTASNELKMVSVNRNRNGYVKNQEISL